MSLLFAERLKSARMLNGLSLQDLAGKLEKKISRQALHKYEKGEVMPDSSMLAMLAAALNVSSDFFFRDSNIELGKVEFRKLSRLPVKEENRIIAEVKDKLSRYLELEEHLGIQTGFSNPLKDIPSVTGWEDIESAAALLRIKWNLGLDPIYNLIELLEDNHIKIIEINAGDSFDGMQAWVNGHIPVIAVNKDKVKSADRVRFTIMHELCHLLIKSIEDLPEREKEKYCHQFAGAMLMPKEMILQELGTKRNKIMIQELGLLKQQYGISIQAIIMRAKDLAIISDAYCRQFFFFLNQMGWKQTEPPEYDFKGIEESSRFRQLLFRALGEEIISISKAAALTNLPVARFRDEYLKMV